MAAQFMFVVDAFIVNVALPSIRGDLAASTDGIYGFTLGFGAAVGFGLGGWLLAANLGGFGWRTVFFVNGPVGIALVIGSLAILPASPRKDGIRLDLAGAGLLLAALVCLIGPLLIGADLGWPACLASTALGIALLPLFWRSQTWVETHGGLPLVHLDLLRDRRFGTGLLTAFLLTFANISFYLLITLYMQNQLGITPLQSGAAVIPLAVVFALVSRASGPRAQRLGALALIQGCSVAITGLSPSWGGSPRRRCLRSPACLSSSARDRPWWWPRSMRGCSARRPKPTAVPLPAC